MIFFSYLTDNDFSYFLCFLNVAGYGPNRSKMTFVKGGIDGFSYISLISVNLFSNQDYSCIIADHCFNKMRNKKYHGTVLKYHTVRTVLKYHTVRTVLKYYTVRTVLKAKRKIVEIGKIGTSNIQIHDLSPLTYKYMTSHFPGFILALELTDTNNSPIPTQQFSLNTCLEKGGEWNGLCTLKTFIVDSGKERAHCSRY